MSARLSTAAILSLAACGASAAQDVAIPDGVAAAQRTAWTQQCTDWDEWDKPGPAFRIHGNTWYVGTCGISAILITSPEGHILIDTGTEAGPEIIARNIEALGFQPEDVRFILSSHEHFDHVGGTAAMRDLTGAQVVASPEAAQVLMSGRASSEDPQHADLPPMRPVEVDRVLDGNTSVRLGENRLLAIPTPGHTLGALTWLWRSCDGEDCRDIVYADSLSPVSSEGYRFSDHPFLVRVYQEALARLGTLSGMGCSTLLTPHPSASGMRDKLLTGNLSAAPGCREYADGLATRLDARLAEEAQAHP